MRLMKVGAACSDGVLAGMLGQAYGRTTATPSPPIALAWWVTAAVLSVLLPATAFLASKPHALFVVAAVAAIAAVLIAWLATCRIRFAGERNEAMRASLEREAMLAEARHRIGNNLTVISAMLSVQRRQLANLGARRAIEQAAGRIRVIGDINHLLNHLTSSNVQIDDVLVGELVAKCIDEAGAENRVQHETSLDAIELPRLLLTPFALLLNECVNGALEHDFPGEAHGVIRVRFEAQSEEQGARRLTLTAEGPVPPTDFEWGSARAAGLAFMKAFALQLGGSFRLERVERGTRAMLIF